VPVASLRRGRRPRPLAVPRTATQDVFGHHSPAWAAEADRRHTSDALSTLGWIALTEDDLSEARELFEESLTLALEIAYRLLQYETLLGLATSAAATGNWRLAARVEAAVETEIRAEHVLETWALPVLARPRKGRPIPPSGKRRGPRGAS
jgi:hypothetical protein